MMDKISYEITNELGILSVSRTNWTKEVNLISWNGKPARLDIREWSQDRVKMSKGITLSREEAMKLYKILQNVFK